MTTISTEIAKEKLAALIEETAQSHEPIQIVSGSHAALLVADEDWRAIQETLYLLSIPGMRESVIEGMNTPLEACSEDLGWDLWDI